MYDDNSSETEDDKGQEFDGELYDNYHLSGREIINRESVSLQNNGHEQNIERNSTKKEEVDNMKKIEKKVREEGKESTLMDKSNMVEDDDAQPEEDEQDEDGSVKNNEDSNDDEEGDVDPRCGSKTPGV